MSCVFPSPKDLHPDSSKEEPGASSEPGPTSTRTLAEDDPDYPKELEGIDWDNLPPTPEFLSTDEVETDADTTERSPLEPVPRTSTLPPIRSKPLPDTRRRTLPLEEEEPPRRTLTPADRGSRRRSEVALERNAIRKQRRRTQQKFTRCRVCHVSVTSRRALYEHQQSRRHRQKANAPRPEELRCAPCLQTFESLDHLERHKRGRRHLAVVTKI